MTLRSTPRTRLAVALIAVLALIGGSLATWHYAIKDESSTPSAHDALLEAATKVDSRTDHPPTGNSSYLLTETTETHRDRGWKYSVTTVRLVRVDDQTEVRTTIEPADPAFSSRSDRSAWRAAGSPQLTGVPTPVEDAQSPAELRLGGRTYPLSEAVEITNHPPAQLLPKLAASDSGGDPFAGGVRVLLTPGLPASAQASVLRALAEIPETSVRPVDVQGSSPSGPTVATQLQLIRPNGLTVTLDSEHGQITSIAGLDHSHINIGAAGFVNCLDFSRSGGPATIFVGCATGAFVVNRIEWDESWGGPEAHGTGVASVTDCTPDCATGKTADYPVTVTLGEQRKCGYNLYLYTRLTVAFTKAVPPDTDKITTEAFGCDDN